MTKYITPAERVAELVAKYGTYRKAAAAVGVSHPYLCRVVSGEKEAGDGLLSKLGLRKEVRYLRTGA